MGDATWPSEAAIEAVFGDLMHDQLCQAWGVPTTASASKLGGARPQAPAMRGHPQQRNNFVPESYAKLIRKLRVAALHLHDYCNSARGGSFCLLLTGKVAEQHGGDGETQFPPSSQPSSYQAQPARGRASTHSCTERANVILLANSAEGRPAS